MRNYIQPGKMLSLLAPYILLSGAGFQVGSIFAVAATDAANGAAVEGSTEGVFDLAKVSAQAWTVGQKIYWDNTAKLATTDGTAGMLIGYATAIAANPTATGNVRLNSGAPSSSEGPQAAIADVATADASDLATAIALVNALKASHNVLLGELRLAGIIAP